MTMVDVALSREDVSRLDSSGIAAGPAKGRPAPTAIKLLLPVWGYRFVKQFLELGLLTLLAPDNLPAVAETLPCEFVILTSFDDEPYIREHPAFACLCAVCPTTIRLMDHLITGSNHSTTITLAYAEEIRSTGRAALDTCFFFLVSDYIVADGSLSHATKRMMAGASGILVGNFQVVLEDGLPWLEEQLSDGNCLALPPRELMRWALSNLHPATIANTVNFALSHNSHSNRLFWRVDGDTVIGRFFLMHMLCIRPEVTDFVIGSSCDYSFVPELCPSGNVDAITDSDEYLVVEMQPRDHEAAFLRPGPFKQAKLAKALSQWTTAQHRRNAEISVVFHAGDVPVTVGAAIAEADAFIADVRREMRRKPMPHRRHPYWRGAIAAFHEATGRRLSRDEWRAVLGLSVTESRLGDLVLDRARFLLFGYPPNVRVWHPRWPDYRVVMAKIAAVLEDPRRRLLMVSDGPTVFTASLADGGERVIRLRSTPFLDAPVERYESLEGRFDRCLVELSEGEMARGDELVDRIAPLMKVDGEIVVVVNNKRGLATAAGFAESIGFHARRLWRPAAIPVAIDFVPAGRLRWLVQRLIGRIGGLAHRRPLIGAPVLVVSGAGLALLSLVANLAAVQRTRAKPHRGVSSSVTLTLRVNASNARDARKYSVNRILRDRHRRRRGLSKAGDGVPALCASARVDGAGASTREPQYERCVDLKSKHGLTPLGLMTNQVWYDDPRRLGFLLARYKFVSKMLSGRRDVGEVGCGDAFGTRIVLQEVDKVTVYDFDPVFIADVRQRYSDRWPIESRVHDIILDTLPNRHDAIYSLDVIEHVTRRDEHAFLANLRGSLTDDGLLIIGTPSLESQAYASPPSKQGHVNCKSAKELKALLGHYFSAVLLFSMNDEVVHTGFYPMAHYLLAICVGKK